MKKWLILSGLLVLVMSIEVEVVGNKVDSLMDENPEAVTVVETSPADNVICEGEPMDGPCVLICEYCYAGGIASKHFGATLTSAWGQCPVCKKYIAF